MVFGGLVVSKLAQRIVDCVTSTLEVLVRSRIFDYFALKSLKTLRDCTH